MQRTTTTKSAAVVLCVVAIVFASLGCSLGESVFGSIAPEAVGDAQTPTPSPTVQPQAADEPQFVDVGEQLVIDVYRRAAPSVVHITTQVITLDFFYGPTPQEGTGSGFVIDKEGHIVTNYHVIRGAQAIEVTLSDDDAKIPAEVIGIDPPNDLAVIKIDVNPSLLTPITLGTSKDLVVGQRTIAIGNPFGLDRTLTTGVISSLGRPLQTDRDTVLYNVIQTDAAINPGNSGGPLLNTRGEVIGINTAIRTDAQGIGFAVPVDTITRVVPELIAEGRYRHPWLGILGYSISLELAKALELPVERGILIAQIYRNSPAHQAGLRGATQEVVIGNRRLRIGGDILVAINDMPVRNMGDLAQYLAENTRVGDEVTLTIYRAEEQMTLSTTLTEQPQ